MSLNSSESSLSLLRSVSIGMAFPGRQVIGSLNLRLTSSFSASCCGSSASTGALRRVGAIFGDSTYMASTRTMVIRQLGMGCLRMLLFLLFFLVKFRRSNKMGRTGLCGDKSCAQAQRVCTSVIGSQLRIGSGLKIIDGFKFKTSCKMGNGDLERCTEVLAAWRWRKRKRGSSVRTQVRNHFARG